LAFIKAKQDEQHIATLNKVDPWDYFETIITKWVKIPKIVVSYNFFQHMKNNLVCKDKGMIELWKME
jgi:hypothetical protein